MDVWQVVHEWRDPDHYEYPEYHSEIEIFFTTRELADQYAEQKRKEIVVVHGWQAEKQDEEYRVGECCVWDRLP